MYNTEVFATLLSREQGVLEELAKEMKLKQTVVSRARTHLQEIEEEWQLR